MQEDQQSKEGLFTRIRQYLGVRRRFIRRRLWNRRDAGIFVVCIVIATLFWLLDALSYRYDSRLTIPIHYKKLPDDKILTSELPQELEVRINASGKDILSLQITSAFNPVSINVAEYLKTTPQTSTGYILTDAQLRAFQRQMPPEMRILDITPDSIKFQFETISKKRVPVRVRSNITFAPQTNLANDIKVTPDSIEISGPTSYIKKHKLWPTKKLVLQNLQTSVRKKVPLMTPKKEHVSIAPNKVEVFIPVTSFTEAEVQVPISIENAPSNFQVVLFPKQVKVIGQVAIDRYESVKPELFTVTADFADINIRQQQTVDLEITEQPEFIKDPRIMPSAVDFIVQKE